MFPTTGWVFKMILELMSKEMLRQQRVRIPEGRRPLGVSGSFLPCWTLQAVAGGCGRGGGQAAVLLLCVAPEWAREPVSNPLPASSSLEAASPLTGKNGLCSARARVGRGRSEHSVSSAS